MRDNLLAFKQARETQAYSGHRNTTVSCEVWGAESATATNPQLQLDEVSPLVGDREATCEVVGFGWLEWFYSW